MVALGSTGATDNEPAAGYVGEGLLPVRFLFLHYSGHGPGGQGFDRDADGCQRGLYPLCRWNIAKATDGTIIGYAQAGGV